MDGFDTLKAIKAARPLVEVVMLTGHATVESAIEGMKLGALDYLMKPCEMEVLMAKVQEAKAKKSRQEGKDRRGPCHEYRSAKGRLRIDRKGASRRPGLAVGTGVPAGATEWRAEPAQDMIRGRPPLQEAVASGAPYGGCGSPDSASRVAATV